MNAYVEDANRIFVGDPNIDRLLQTYQEDVTTIFEQNPPDPDKQIKDFRSLTHDFEKAVIGAVSPPEPDTPTKNIAYLATKSKSCPLNSYICNKSGSSESGDS